MAFQTLTEVLSAHGYASAQAARADMVAFVCLDCGSIAMVTPPADQRDEAGRQEQQRLIMWECCSPATDYTI